ncbi:Panacea domain-containing protein [Lysinibacillus halotolerans]|uniref:DUF4065 domain-containing protein n=1 Tax=Lysinibacillus halotolerans TaxID=1368476 RepID=A0A3M8HDB0_9BACI|nr:type II toxin-antitoxin system antitoxin SocA domain-containing protein [Lysinibacillus halotolerans]RND00259.1 DUF4065 domain-containing protein [Lysinibacillus halotolerans]
MADVRDVAKYFISLSTETTKFAITPLKLQKLLYYAQGYYLRETSNPLFNDDLLAWDHGPVNRTIYDEYKRHGYYTIPREPFDDSLLTEKEKEIIKNVWYEYGDLDGKTLEELTHQEDPWLFTKKNQVIEKELIKKFFSEQVEHALVR